MSSNTSTKWKKLLRQAYLEQRQLAALHQLGYEHVLIRLHCAEAEGVETLKPMVQNGKLESLYDRKK